MRSVPTEPGLYLVKTEDNQWWNGVACVEGSAPFLYVKQIWFPWIERYLDGRSDVYTNVAPAYVKEWGKRLVSKEELEG